MKLYDKEYMNRVKNGKGYSSFTEDELNRIKEADITSGYQLRFIGIFSIVIFSFLLLISLVLLVSEPKNPITWFIIGYWTSPLALVFFGFTYKPKNSSKWVNKWIRREKRILEE